MDHPSPPTLGLQWIRESGKTPERKKPGPKKKALANEKRLF
jgi:hypothetical protein